jgi:hypothetical protein
MATAEPARQLVKEKKATPPESPFCCPKISKSCLPGAAIDADSTQFDDFIVVGDLDTGGAKHDRR